MFLKKLAQMSADCPEGLALCGEDSQWTWRQYYHAVEALAGQLATLGVNRLALEADNHPHWAIIDLACLAAGVVIIPVPSFFTPAQKAWVLSSASVDAQMGDVSASGHWQKYDTLLRPLLIRKVNDPVALPSGTAKITFTSGTTGEPKGVCLSEAGMFWTAGTLANELSPLKLTRHLVVLPLSILLENICGIYIPLMLGVSTVISPSSKVGFEGSSRFNATRFLEYLTTRKPDSLMLVPELLRVLLQLHLKFPTSTESLKFIAVGGGRISPEILQLAMKSGLPVFEGYGLSECGSVVSLNLPGGVKHNSVGAPLPGITISIDDTSQLIVSSPANALGYLGTDMPMYAVATGDLGRLDEDGYIHIQGRLKNIQINAYGRNFSPEWPESEAMLCPSVRRIVIFGEGLKHNIALVDAFEGQEAAAREQLLSLSARLPDYAQPHRLIFTSEISAPGMFTPNGRPRRDAIWQTLHPHMFTLLEKEEK
jgi:long-subunit acyl-CoA synthetase (AMP-forming)